MKSAADPGEVLSLGYTEVGVDDAFLGVPGLANIKTNGSRLGFRLTSSGFVGILTPQRSKVPRLFDNPEMSLHLHNARSSQIEAPFRNWVAWSLREDY